MPFYTEDDIAEAITAGSSGTSIAKAAREWRLPRGTLRGRIKGATTKKQQMADQQKLSSIQEDYLVNWAQVQGSLGLPPSRLQLRTAAECILQTTAQSGTLGKNWVSKFLRRNPSIKTLPGKHIIVDRAEGAIH